MAFTIHPDYFPSRNTVTTAFGIGQLKEVTAVNATIGFTLITGGLSATVDAYSISVDDRIILTDTFDASGLGVGAEAAQFFANGVDTKTTGVDIVLNYKKQWMDLHDAYLVESLATKR